MNSPGRFSYRDYELRVRNLAAVEAHLRGFVKSFVGCQLVVDVGSGAGIFLRLLRDAGIQAIGIENDPALIREARAQGFAIVSGDAAAVWSQVPAGFDGLFCSHLLEHLTFEQVIDLVAGFAPHIKRGGIVVFAFPNPASVETQFFQFWQDPQHIRLYDPALITALLEHYGFTIVRVFSQGTWGEIPPKATPNSSGIIGALRKLPFAPRLERAAKNAVRGWLDLAALEAETDYVRKLREIGREAVIVARK